MTKEINRDELCAAIETIGKFLKQLKAQIPKDSLLSSKETYVMSSIEWQIEFLQGLIRDIDSGGLAWWSAYKTIKGNK